MSSHLEFCIDHERVQRRFRSISAHAVGGTQLRVAVVVAHVVPEIDIDYDLTPSMTIGVLFILLEFSGFLMYRTSICSRPIVEYRGDYATSTRCGYT